LSKYVRLIKYKTLKPAAHAQRAPQVLDLVFNYADVLPAAHAQRAPQVLDLVFNYADVLR